MDFLLNYDLTDFDYIIVSSIICTSHILTWLNCPLLILISFYGFLNCCGSAKLIDIYCNRHNISASSGLNDPAVATGISDLVYESKEVHKEPHISNAIDPELAMAWAAGLDDDGLWGNNAPAMDKVRCL